MILLNSTTVYISWSAPFTLEGVDILGYNVCVITTGNKETNLVIGTVLYYPLDPDTGNFTAIVVPFNEIGLGGSADVTYTCELCMHMSRPMHIYSLIINLWYNFSEHATILSVG